MQVVILDKYINVEIQRKSNKNLYMRFKDGNTLLVTCGHFTTDSYVLSIINKNIKDLEKMLKAKLAEEEKENDFYYLGRKYNIVYDGVTKNVYFDGNDVVAKDKIILDKFYLSEVKRLFTLEVNRCLEYFQDIPKFTLKFRNMKTRWGVNNRGNNTITLNTLLLKKDLDLLDYVIIHELCHFYEANHSDRFWAHVEKYYPKYKEARKRLRTN